MISITKDEKIIKTALEVIGGIEDESISVSSSLLKCLKIARLLDDEEGMAWLQYEYSGYPRDEKGMIPYEAWQIGKKHGRCYIEDNKEYFFLESASELETAIEADKVALKAYSTAGTSVSGDLALLAMRNLTDSVTNNTSVLLSLIKKFQKSLSILKGYYYDYALRKYLEMTFSNTVSEVFSLYRNKVDNYLAELPNDILQKLKAIEGKINSDNVESYSQALTTCRRLFENISNELFNKVFPNFQEKSYKTKTGKDIDITGDHYINRLSAVIEILVDKSPNKSLTGSSILYTLDWIENLNMMQCKGVHDNITKQEAMQCIIHTYICIGDILSLQ